MEVDRGVAERMQGRTTGTSRKRREGQHGTKGERCVNAKPKPRKNSRRSIAKMMLRELSGRTRPTKYRRSRALDRERLPAIAEILLQIDAEISALETQLTKARLVKQGMMQELLTGRIRLV